MRKKIKRIDLTQGLSLSYLWGAGGTSIRQGRLLDGGV